MKKNRKTVISKKMALINSGLLLLISSITFAPLTSCSSTNAANTAELNLRSAQYLNPDVNGRASPVVVTLYQLKNPYQFKQANYAALVNNSSQVLGTNLIDKETIEIRPNSHKTITQTITPDTNYLGIVAAYRNINRAIWHQVVNVSDTKNKSAKINIYLASEALNVRVNKKD